jgi:AraC-like DNA-binding protein
MSGLDLFREAGTSFQTTDPVVAFRHLSEALSRHKMPAVREAINMSYRHVDIPGLSIYRLRYGAPVRLELSPPEDHYILQLTLKGSTAACFDGKIETISNPGDFIVVNPGRDFTKKWEAEADQLMLRISAAALGQAMGNGIGDLAGRHVIFEPQTVSLEKTPTLFGYIRMLCEDFDSGECMLAKPSIAKSVVTSIASLMLHSLPNDKERTPYSLQSPVVPYYVQRALNFIQAHYQQDLTLGRIAAASAVSRRALHRGFQKFRNQTPMQYLRSVRLDKAHQRLREMPIASGTVTAVAEACGFRHLGRFSRAYAARFGELPSETAGSNPL